ncbi:MULTISPECIES: serine/threonine-protein kinase [Sorangium]|uniref:Protein kinase n=1 Tax=Sorangium cellulosum TaxID=56 RepID=A0A4P2QLL3_SORCE|nr:MULTISPECIES: serine/threonine-protein kinase [Sorangium]AUX30706.1 protein kinase [Sorangium cellulosum]WCQ90093.1 serine-threonine kinase [Sorangium sp. Soce836]
MEPAPSRRIPRVGDIIGGKYRVERVLGRGGMGLVVSAHHVSLRHRVALKFLLPEGRTTPGALERFFREAQAAAAIASEHIARVIDVGQTDEELPYFVMEHLSGIDLEALVETRGPLPVEQAVSYVIEACDALAEAHALGIVHRDLKPGNLFLASRADGSTLIKVLDFGISKASEAGALGLNAKLTTSSVVLGSPRYMSPEHIRNTRTVDARSDIWALGMTLYQLLTGRLPFENDAVSALFVSIVTDPPVPPRAHRPEIPVELEYILLMCLEKNPAHRPQTVAELVSLLEPLASERARLTAARILRRAMGNETVDAPPAPDRPRVVDEDAPTLTGSRSVAPGTWCVAAERAQGSAPPTQPSAADPPPAAIAASVPPMAGPSPAETIAASVPPAAGPSPAASVPPPGAASTAMAPHLGEPLAPAAAPSERHERDPAGDARGRRGRRSAALPAAALAVLLGGAAALAWLGRGATQVAGAPPAGEAASRDAPGRDAPAAMPAADEAPEASPLPPSAILAPPAAAVAAAASGFAAAGAALAPSSSARPARPRAVLAPPAAPTAGGEPAAGGEAPATRAVRLREHR